VTVATHEDEPTGHFVGQGDSRNTTISFAIRVSYPAIGAWAIEPTTRVIVSVIVTFPPASAARAKLRAFTQFNDRSSGYPTAESVRLL